MKSWTAISVLAETGSKLRTVTVKTWTTCNSASISVAGHKGPVLGPRCIGPEKGSNPHIILSLSHTYLPIIKRENTTENSDAYPINERQTQNKHLTELQLCSEQNILCFHCAAQLHSGCHVYTEVCRVRLGPYMHNTVFTMTNTWGQAAWNLRFIARNFQYHITFLTHFHNMAKLYAYHERTMWWHFM